nr:hypothetical protein [Tanacetum cinerariifolium]
MSFLILPSSIYLEGKWPINVDHPFVIVNHDFATDPFNVLAHMRDKNSFCHSEVLSCKYMNADGFYYFYLRIKGIEAGILGVYKVIVACDLINGLMIRVPLDSADLV